MKKFTITLLISILCCGIAIAQPPQQRQKPQPQPRAELNAEEYMQFQIDLLVKQLRLSEDKIEPFKSLYSEYTQKMETLHPKERPSHQDRNQAPAREENSQPKKSAAEVEAEILESFDLADKSNALKREYYFKFKEILSPQKILRMYNLERKLRERMIYESRRRTAGAGQE